eukprot:420031_1
MSDITVLDMVILYATYCILFIYLYIFICNFASHFKFNRCTCPWIVRDENVSAIYPTLLAFHISIGLILSFLITLITWNNSYYSTQSISCYMQFKLFSTSVLQPVWMTNIFHLIAACAMYILLLLETYLSYGRYYGCIYYVMKKSDTPSKYRLFLPFSVYNIFLFALVWFSIITIPVIALFVSTSHILINTYYNYYFYIGIKLSYQNVLEIEQVKATRAQIHQQIRQIRVLFQLSFASTIISAFTICAFISCDSLLRIVPICLCCSSFCLFLVFNNNKTLFEATIRCQCKTIHTMLCTAPFVIVKRRRTSRISLKKLKKPSTGKKSKRELKPVDSASVYQPDEMDERDKKVLELKKKTAQKVGFGADVLMDIIASEDDLKIPPPKSALKMQRSSSLNFDDLKMDDATPVPIIRKTSSDHGRRPASPGAITVNKKSNSSSLSSFQTIREWMAPTSFATISVDRSTAKSINEFLRGYGFTTRSLDILKEDLSDLEARIPDVIVEADMEVDETVWI